MTANRTTPVKQQEEQQQQQQEEGEEEVENCVAGGYWAVRLIDDLTCSPTNFQLI